MNYVRKRGYVKWTDQNGTKHKVREEDFDKQSQDSENEYELTEVLEQPERLD